MRATKIKLSELVSNKEQPRKHFDEESIAELSASIQKDGLIQPITVRKVSQDTFEIVQGERRYRAAKLAGLSEIPAFIREIDDKEAFHLAVIENIQRENMTPIEEAQAFARYVEMGYTHAEIAEKISKGRTYVSSKLRLLRLMPEIQDMIAEGKISDGHAKQLLKLQNVFLLNNNNLFEWGQELFISEYAEAEKISVVDVREFSRKIEHSVTVSVLNIFFDTKACEDDASHWLDLCDMVNVRILEITPEHLETACQYEVDNLPLPKSGKKSELYKKFGEIHAKYEEIKEALSGLTDAEKVDIWAEKATMIHANKIGQLFNDIEVARKDLSKSYRDAATIEKKRGKKEVATDLIELASKIEGMTSDEFIDYFLDTELEKLGFDSWDEAQKSVT